MREISGIGVRACDRPPMREPHACCEHLGEESWEGWEGQR